ncbi:kinesin-like protein KIF9 [Diorhabda sublineata]|uniref:kinesin-like protein KIF9 n=1 Tax=Diorhabda sublineata TaxID=1163346 RepID=UPI0024E0E112|nr:kinesin-like protein KIF9 [Diorhabda sublineata]
MSCPTISSVVNPTVSYQLGNNHVRVFYRICSVEKPTWEHVKIKNSTVFVRKLQQIKDPSKSHQPPSYWEFNTDGVFHNCTQNNIHSAVVEGLIEKLKDGNNAVIVAFGQTGTGKSVTLSGIELVSDENFGVIPRMLRELMMFKKSMQTNNTITLEMTYLEFSKTAVFDLFREYPNNLNTWHASQDAKKIAIISENQALKALYLGEGRKETKKHNYYSHVNTSVLSFYVTIEDLNYSDGHKIEVRLHFIDLAGSDTVGNLTCLFKNKTEVGAANLTKTSLEQFFLSLMERSPEMIRARQRTNPLIYFLKDDLNNNNSLRFIGHIKTTIEDLQTTLSMMRFGQILRGYTPTIKKIEQPTKMSLEGRVKYLQRQIKELKEEQIQNSILLNRDLTTNMTSERIAHLQRTVKAYLLNEISEIDVIRVSDVAMVFNIFREMYNNWETEKQKFVREGSVATVNRKNTESDVSLPKKRGSIRSSSTLNTRVSKEKRRSRRSKDGIVDADKVDKQVSVQSFLDMSSIKITSQTLRSNQERFSVTSGSISQIPKRKRSKFGVMLNKRSSVIKKKSVGSFIFGNIPDISQIPENIPENTEAWNSYTKESDYNNFMVEYKANEKNISDTYAQYVEEMKALKEEKDKIYAMEQEILEAKLMIKYKTIDCDKFTESILNEAANKCGENIERAKLVILDKQEIVLRCLAELKLYLNNRKELRKQLSINFDNYCKENFNITFPAAKSLSFVEMVGIFLLHRYL